MVLSIVHTTNLSTRAASILSKWEESLVWLALRALISLRIMSSASLKGNLGSNGTLLVTANFAKISTRLLQANMTG